MNTVKSLKTNSVKTDELSNLITINSPKIVLDKNVSDDISNAIVQVVSIVQSWLNRDKYTKKEDFFELLYVKKLLEEGIPCIIRKPKGYGDGGIDIQGCYG
ncbi:5918_t:CDS:2, partial [Cetraspora pellucida]